MGQKMKCFLIVLSLRILGMPSFAWAQEEPHPVDEWIKEQQAKVEEDRQRVESAEAARSASQNNANMPNTSRPSESPQERRLIYKKPTSNVGGRTWGR